MLANVIAPDSVLAIVLHVIIILSALLLGTRYGGIGLGLISGIGLMLMVFVFGLAPGEPPCRSCSQSLPLSAVQPHCNKHKVWK